MKFREKNDVLIYFNVFYKFQGDSRFLYKIPGFSRSLGNPAQYNPA